MGYDDPRAWPIKTSGSWLEGFMFGTTYFCYTQNIKALDLVVSEKKIFLRFPIVSLQEMMTPGIMENSLCEIGPLKPVLYIVRMRFEGVKSKNQ